MSYIKDLTKMKWDHELYLSYDESLPKEFEATLIGWLGEKVIATGEVSGNFFKKLKWAYNHQSIDQGWLGYHTCEICDNYDDRGEILIQTDSQNYVSPRMIIHYIEKHNYLPPKEFMEAVEKISPFEVPKSSIFQALNSLDKNQETWAIQFLRDVKKYQTKPFTKDHGLLVKRYAYIHERLTPKDKKEFATEFDYFIKTRDFGSEQINVLNDLDTQSYIFRAEPK